MKQICNADRCLPKPVSVPEVFGKRLLTLRAKLDLLGVMLGQAVGVGPSTGGVGAAWEAEHQSQDIPSLSRVVERTSFSCARPVRRRPTGDRGGAEMPIHHGSVWLGPGRVPHPKRPL